MDGDAATLQALLLQMSMNDTALVREAEGKIREAIGAPACAPVLFQLLRHSPHASARQLAAVLLRLCLPKVWHGFGAEEKQTSQRMLLEALANESQRIVSLNTVYIVSTLSKLEMAQDNQQAAVWPELLEFLQRFAQSDQPQQQELAMRLFYALTETVGTAFQPHFAELRDLYSRVLRTSGDARVQAAALKAAGSLIDFLSSGEDVLVFRELVPLILEGLERNAQDETLAVQILQVLAQLAESPVPILNKNIEQLLVVLLKVIRDPETEEGTKRVAIETLCTLLQCKSRFVSKLGALEPLLETALACLRWDFPRFVQVLSEHDLPQEQLLLRKQQQQQQGEEEDQLCDFGQRVTSSLATFLSPRLVFRPLLRAALERIQTPGAAVGGVPEQWVGLSLVLHASEGLADSLMGEKGVIEELLKCVMPLAENSPDPILRATALMCMAEWATYLEPAIVAYMPTMLPTVIKLLGDPKSNLVRSCAGDVVELICDEIEEDELTPYLEELVQRLLGMSQHGINVSVRSTALSALSSVMVTTGPAYMPYFDTTCHVLGQLATLTDEPLLQIRGHATSALGNLALAASRKTEDGNNNLGRFKPLLEALLDNAAKGLVFDDMELNRLTYATLGNLADAFDEEITPYAEAMADMLVSSQELDEDAQLSVSDPDGALVPSSVRDKFQANPAEAGLRADAANGGAANGGATDAGEEAGASYQPGVRYEMSLRTEVLEAKKSAVYAMGRLAANVSPAFIAQHYSAMLGCCERVLDHMHPTLKSNAVESIGVLVLALARSHPPAPLGDEAKKKLFDWAQETLCEVESEQAWLPGFPPHAPIADPLAKMLASVVPQLLDLIVNDKEKEVVAACCSALDTIVAHIGPAALAVPVPGSAPGSTTPALEPMVELCRQLCCDKTYCQRLDVFDDPTASQDGAVGGEDTGDEDEDDRDTQILFDSTCTLINSLAAACGPSFAPMAGPLFGDLLHRIHRSSQRRETTLGVFAQVILALGAGGSDPFVEALLPLALGSVDDDSMLTRQAAVFLTGNLVLLGGSKLHHNADGLLHILHELEPLLGGAAEARAMVDRLGGDHMPDELAEMQAVVDNAVGTLARLLYVSLGAGSNAVPVEHVFPFVLSLLPLRADLSENFAVFRGLAAVVQSEHACVAANLEPLLRACAHTVDAVHDAASPQEMAHQQIATIIRSLLQSGLREAAGKVLAGLNPSAESPFGAFLARLGL